MKVSGLLLLTFLFLVLPFMILQTLVMPALDQLRYTYENADSIATNAVQD